MAGITDKETAELLRELETQLDNSPPRDVQMSDTPGPARRLDSMPDVSMTPLRDTPQSLVAKSPKPATEVKANLNDMFEHLEQDPAKQAWEQEQWGDDYWRDESWNAGWKHMPKSWMSRS